MGSLRPPGRKPARPVLAFRLGRHGVSGDQLGLLGQAARASDSRKLQYLAGLLHNRDIQSGVEPVDYRWLRLCPQLGEANFHAPRDRAFKVFTRYVLQELSPSPGLSKIDPDSTEIAFLLGAGASRPAPSNIPLVGELLPELLERARDMERDDLSTLADYCDANDIRNIESLLTAAQLSVYCSRHPDVLRLVNFLLYGRRLSIDGLPSGHRADAQSCRPGAVRGPVDGGLSVAYLTDTLQTLFGLIAGHMLPAPTNPVHQAIAEFAASHRECTIITTNYDCCMEGALGSADRDFSYGLPFSNSLDDAPRVGDSVSLLKLHGSLNWFYCETCQAVVLVPPEQLAEAFRSGRSTATPYPVRGHCQSCRGILRPMLVPPQALKFDVALPLTRLLEQASQALERADVLIVVGYSFADADRHITQALLGAARRNRRLRFLVVDQDLEVVARVRYKIGRQLGKLGQKRILKLPGKCEANLPVFLAGQYPGSADLARRARRGHHVYSGD